MHFANADAPDDGGPAGVAAQLRAFDRALADWTGLRSMANSAALFMQPQVGGDWVRPGIALYGGTPCAGRPAASFGLRAAMTLRSSLIAVQQLNVATAWVTAHAGVRRNPAASVSWPAATPMATRGWRPRARRSRWTGTIVPLAGRVSMDMITVDLSSAPDAKVGSTVELWGHQVPIDTVAELSGTVGYELMCALAPRVPVEVID
jgi:alanine racemase